MSQPAGSSQLPRSGRWPAVVPAHPGPPITAESARKTLSLSSANALKNGLAFDAGGNLWVTDTANNRVLRYPVNALKAAVNGLAADLVVGQADFTSTTGAASVMSKTNLNAPQGSHSILPTGSS